jgi:hypothetical protein
MPFSVTSCNHVGVVGHFVTVTSPLLMAIVAAISSATRVTQVSLIAFVTVTASARFSHVVSAISSAVGGFHQFGDGL